MAGPDKYELVADLARRRGYFWPSFEIYGGVSGFLDLGPLGTSMKRRIIEKWLDTFIRKHGFVEISTPVITPERIFEASGHVAHFKDLMIECLNCKRRFKADSLLKEAANIQAEAFSLSEIGQTINEKQIRCVECGGQLSKPEYFSTMFRTTIGPYSESVAYGRPEAAQGMFVDFKRVYESVREKMPMAIAQIGTALRNEISPRQGPIRLREFTIMEFEFFYDPEESRCPHIGEVSDKEIRILPLQLRDKGIEEPTTATIRQILDKKYVVSEWSAYFMGLSQEFMSSLGIPPVNQRFLEKSPNERAHYSSQTYDHEILLDRWGWVEMAGHANRSNHDLSSHIKGSGADLTVFKKYDEPVTRRERVARPIDSAIGPAFKAQAATVRKLIQSAKSADIERSIKEKGFYLADEFKILPAHVRFDWIDSKESGRRFVPEVVEPSFGAERLLYAALEYAYTQTKDRVVLNIPIDVAPIQVSVFPLMAKDGLDKRARAVCEMLRRARFDVDYDESGTIGRRYARADEVGVPIAVTIDYDTLKDETVTLRDRVTWKQVRAPVGSLVDSLRAYFEKSCPFQKLGTQILDKSDS
ncbi:MAG TPA: glycine--tRNA ligase [Candidatus Acidoferrum sp.]|nr:glycine--tRNA ligase [Candidatus Acidoferrum sp.]